MSMTAEKLANSLKISIEEAKQVLEMDKRIDRGEKLFELPPELEAGAKKARRADRKKVENVKRERKPDEDKRELIQYLESSLEDAYPDLDLGNITITNPEREMEFTYNGIKYRLTLMRPRKQMEDGNIFHLFWNHNWKIFPRKILEQMVISAGRHWR